MEEILASRESENVTENVDGESVEESANCEDVSEEECESLGDVGFDAFSCFGWDEKETPKWLKACANVWYFLISFLWFLFGAVTFAPVVFISNKVNVLFKDKKRSFVFAVLIYAAFIALMVWFFVSRRVPQSA